MKLKKTVIGFLSMHALLLASPVDMMIGARGYGFGGAYVALANDPSAAYWNPSRLPQVQHISLMNSNWILQDVDGLNVNYANCTFPISNVGTFAAGWLLTNATLESGRFNDAGNVELSKTSASEHQFSLSFGRTIIESIGIFRKVSAGLTINRYTFLSEDNNGTGLGFDAGVSTEFPYGICFGFTARNLGTEIMGYMIDPELRWGIGYTRLFASSHRLSAEIDGLYKLNRDYKNVTTLEPSKNNIKGFGGIEYAVVLKDFEFAIRGGGNALVISNSQDMYNFTTGAGVIWRGYSLQYAFMGITDRDLSLGYGHRVSLAIELDRLVSKSTKPAE